MNNNPINYSDPSGHWVFEDTPNDPNYVPANSGINPFRRYVTAGVTQGEASKIFVKTMSDPGNDIVNWFDFGGKNTLGGLGYHPGVYFHSTLNVQKGTSILSVLPGRVVEVTKDRTKDFGLHVVLEHDIYGVSLFSVYAHLDATSVTENQIVPTGKKLGGMGNTPFLEKKDLYGVMHLHFEVRTEHNVILDDQGNYLTLKIGLWMLIGLIHMMSFMPIG